MQELHHAEVLASRDSPDPEAGRVLLVEHDPPVITVTRRPSAASHLVASEAMLKALGVQLCQTDRGGDITYHGPGQLVVYPIIDLNYHTLRLHDYMRLLELAVIDALAHFGVHAQRDPSATGVWVQGAPPAAPDQLAKICAMGVRIRRWVSMHGLAINVSTNLDHFNLIVPCGLVGRPVTSLHRILGDRSPSFEEVKTAIVQALESQLHSSWARRTSRPSQGDEQ